MTPEAIPTYEVPMIPIEPIEEPKPISVETVHPIVLSTAQKVFTSLPSCSESSLNEMLVTLQSQFPSVEIKPSNIISCQKLGDS